MRWICWNSLARQPASASPPPLKLSAANDGAKLETCQYRKQWSAQINLPFHSFGGQTGRDKGCCLTPAMSRLINTCTICNLRVKNSSTIRACFTVNNTDHLLNMSTRVEWMQPTVAGVCRQTNMLKRALIMYSLLNKHAASQKNKQTQTKSRQSSSIAACGSEFLMNYWLKPHIGDCRGAHQDHFIHQAWQSSPAGAQGNSTSLKAASAYSHITHAISKS